MLDELVGAWLERITELKRLTLLRIDDGTRGLFVKDLEGLEANISALEQQVAVLKARINAELATMRKVEALNQAIAAQGQHISAVATHLPAGLPKPMITSVQGAILARPGGQAGAFDVAHSGAMGRAAPHGQAEEPVKRRKEPPTCYVSASELESAPAYLRGRLQPEKVNAAITELAEHAANNQKLLAMLKAGGSKLTPADRQRATELMRNVASKSEATGHFWCLESDLRSGNALKLDKSGKTMLTLLRHMGRLQEVRVTVEGVATTAYVLLEEPQRR